MNKTFEYYEKFGFTKEYFIDQYSKDKNNARRTWYLLGKALQDNLNYSDGEGVELECRIHALSKNLEYQERMLKEAEDDFYEKY